MCNLYTVRATRDEIAAHFQASDDWRGQIETAQSNYAEEVYPGYPSPAIAKGSLKTMGGDFLFRWSASELAFRSNRSRSTMPAPTNWQLSSGAAVLKPGVALYRSLHSLRQKGKRAGRLPRGFQYRTNRYLPVRVYGDGAKNGAKYTQ